jgi:uncharacterized protein
VAVENFWLETRGAAVRFAVHVQPRASQTKIRGLHGDAIKVQLSAPPVDGAANEALRDLFAELLGVARSAVRIVAGEHSRRKVVEVAGVDQESVRRLVFEVTTR